MKLFGGILLAIHTLGILLATLAAWYAVQTLVLSGMVLAPTGLAIAFISFRGCRPIGFYYGLTAPTATVICFALICGLDWDNNDARAPIGVFLALFSLICVPLGVVGVGELCESRPRKQRLPAHFGISSLLWLMLFLSLFLSCLRAESQQGMAIVVFVGYAMFDWRAVREFRHEQATYSEV